MWELCLITCKMADSITAVASAVAALAASAGLIYIARQLHNARQTLQFAAAEHLYSRMHDIHKLFLDRPELRPYFYERVRPGRWSGHKRKAEVMAELLADFFQQVFLELNTLPLQTRAGWREYMSHVLRHSPTLLNFVESHRAWYPSNFAGELLGPTCRTTPSTPPESPRDL